MTLQWSAPSILDYREWRMSHITDQQVLAQEALKELIIHSNLYRIWQDRAIYVFIRDKETAQVLSTYQVEYLGDSKFEIYRT